LIHHHKGKADLIQVGAKTTLHWKTVISSASFKSRQIDHSVALYGSKSSLYEQNIIFFMKQKNKLNSV
jgi:hypothetical protein